MNWKEILLKGSVWVSILIFLCTVASYYVGKSGTIKNKRRKK